MVRDYKRTYRHVRKAKSYAPYMIYSKENLQQAVADVKANLLTIRQAAAKYNVPKSTIGGHCNTKTKPKQKQPGHPTLFTEDEEAIFVDYCIILSEWGFPFDPLDLRIFAQRYLNKIGKTVYTLKNNLPGPDWAKNFLRRHKDKISNRFAANISTDRAKITPEIVESFIENYSKNVEGVSPSNIINYDETNLCDDPGAKKYIFKRGTKYPERLINNSKTAVSVMFSGTAGGQMLPIYVVYKSEHLWDTWMEGGPPDTRYNRSKSGWFDGTTFEDWFLTIILPYAKKIPGRKVVVGDNLSSHFSTRILEECEKHDITFVCLPPKSTHLLQPLDVAFFGPLKHYWKLILTNWKKTEGKKHKTLVKTAFPRLLSKLYSMMSEKNVLSENIKAGFDKAGLFPVNAARPISRLPRSRQSAENIGQAASAVVVDILQDLRGYKDAEAGPSKRRKRCEVEPGKSITAQDIAPKEQTSKKGKGVGKKSHPGNNVATTPISCSQNKENMDCNTPPIISVSNREDEPILIQDKNPPKKQTSKKGKGVEKKNESASTVPLPPQSTEHSDSESLKLNNPKNPSLTLTVSEKNKRSSISKSQQMNKQLKTKKSSREKSSAKRCTVENSDSNDSFDHEFAFPGSILETVQRQKEYLLASGGSTTSVSDDMSVHSDSDIIDTILTDEHDSEDTYCSYDEMLRSPTKTTQILPICVADSSASTFHIKSTSHGNAETACSSKTAQMPSISIDTDPCTRTLDEDTKSNSNDDAEMGSPPKTAQMLSIFPNADPGGRTLNECTKTNPNDDAEMGSPPKTAQMTSISPNADPGARTLNDPTKTNPNDDAEMGSPPKTAQMTSISPNTDPGTSTLDEPTTTNPNDTDVFSVNDTVLVRYYINKAWKYYVGVICARYDNGSYDITFYTTIKKKGVITFKNPKKVDRDVVPPLSVVKFIEIVEKSSKPTEYALKNEEDIIYF